MTTRRQRQAPRMAALWIALSVSVVAVMLSSESSPAPAAESTAASKRSCAVTGTTVKSSRLARVYRVGSREEHRVFGCLRRSGRTYFLGDYELFNPRSGFYQGTGRLVLVGRFVAYDRRVCSPSGMCTGGTIVRRDLHSGRVVGFANPIPNADPVSDLELTRAGSVAWIRREDPLSPVYTVRKLDVGLGVILDVGPDIGPRSLALRGSRVSWTKGGQPFAAPLR